MEGQVRNNALNTYGIALFFAIKATKALCQAKTRMGDVDGQQEACLSQNLWGPGTTQTADQTVNSLLPVTCSLPGLSILVSALESNEKLVPSRIYVITSLAQCDCIWRQSL